MHLGTVINVPFYSRSQASAFNNATGAPPKPTGPMVALRVVGFEASEFEFPSGTTPSYDLYVTSAFRADRASTNSCWLCVLGAPARRCCRPPAIPSGCPRPERGWSGARTSKPNPSRRRSILKPSDGGSWHCWLLSSDWRWWARPLRCQSIVEGEDYPTMAALGADRRQLVTLGMARNLVVALAGAAGAVLVATALSSVAPLGEALSRRPPLASLSTPSSCHSGHSP